MLLAAVLVCFAAVGVATAAVVAFNPFSDQQVGQSYANGTLLPSNQWVSPLGTRVFQDNARLLASSISPNGDYLATLTWDDYNTTLTVVNLTNGTSKSTGVGNGALRQLPVGSVCQRRHQRLARPAAVVGRRKHDLGLANRLRR